MGARRPAGRRTRRPVRPYFSLTRSNASVLRHIRQDHLVSRLEPAPHLDRVHRRLAHGHLRPRAVDAVLVDAEQADHALLLPVGGPAHIEHVDQVLELDRAVHAQIGPRALGELPLERDVHRDRAVEHGRVDPRHPARDDAVARVDGGRLADLDVLGLRLRDLELGLQLRLVRHARQVGPRLHVSAHVDRHLLQHPGDAGPHVQLVDLAVAQHDQRPQAIDLGLLHGQLRGPRLAQLHVALAFDLVLRLEALGLDLRQLARQGRDEPLVGQLGVGLRLHLRLAELRRRARGLRLLRQQVVLHRDPEVRQLRLGRLQLLLGLEQLLRLGRVAQDEDHGLGLHLGPGIDDDALDAPGGDRGNPADVLGNQRAQTPHLPLDVATLDRVDIHGRPLDRRCGGLQAGQRDRDERNGHQGNGADDDPADLLVPRDTRWALNVHAR